MNVQYKSSNPSKGGGIYIMSGEAVNCIVAFNMDDNGAGIDGDGGNVINCTVARNSNTPTYVRIASGTYQPFSGASTTLLTRYVYLDAFYIASTETTGGQYACFMAAIDYDGTTEPYLKASDVNAIKSAKMPTEVNYMGYPSGIIVSDYVIFAAYSTSGCTTPGTSCWNLISSQTNLSYGGALTNNNSVVWYPNTDVSGDTTTTGEDKKRDNYPMTYVSWYGSIAFCLWLGGSLPTEAQWEYAGRHTSGGTTNDSYQYAGSSSADGVGWHSGNSGTGGGTTTQHAHEVGKKAATSAGLYDMSGNVYELCIDEWGGVYMNAASSLTVANGKNLVSSDVSNNGETLGAPLRNPIACASSSSSRVLRGGYWNFSATYCSLGDRSASTPSYVIYYLGVRSVCCP
jgi:formylglycine-generating enzyme required for sulfatase activity